jgi:(2R)-3-sulfolactate dehydrogenase (NADP+)
LIIDQASSATAFVNIVRAAQEGREKPQGWALDEAKAPTTDPAKAMHGALLPFGGYKGANVALMVEVLSAGVSGASWSLDAGDFRAGDRCPSIGLTVIALLPGDSRFDRRLSEQLDRLERLGVFIPGAEAPRGAYAADDIIEVDGELLERIRIF